MSDDITPISTVGTIFGMPTADLIEMAGRHEMTPKGFDRRIAEATKSTDSWLLKRAGKVDILTINRPLASENFHWQQWNHLKYRPLTAAIYEALSNRETQHLVLDINSPGGDVLGISDVIAALSGREGLNKRVIAYIRGKGTSCAYWIGSAADEIVIAPSAQAGCIGVTATFIDDTKRLKMLGLEKATVVSNQTPNKLIDPKAKAGMKAIQTLLDDMADVMIGDIAKGRGWDDPDAMMEAFGRGTTYVGQKAVDVGLADRVGSLEDVLVGLGVGDPHQFGRSIYMGHEDSLQTQGRAPSTSMSEAQVHDQPDSVEARGAAPTHLTDGLSTDDLDLETGLHSLSDSSSKARDALIAVLNDTGRESQVTATAGSEPNTPEEPLQAGQDRSAQAGASTETHPTDAPAAGLAAHTPDEEDAMSVQTETPAPAEGQVSTDVQAPAGTAIEANGAAPEANTAELEKLREQNAKLSAKVEELTVNLDLSTAKDAQGKEITASALQAQMTEMQGQIAGLLEAKEELEAKAADDAFEAYWKGHPGATPARKEEARAFAKENGLDTLKAAAGFFGTAPVPTGTLGADYVETDEDLLSRGALSAKAREYAAAEGCSFKAGMNLVAERHPEEFNQVFGHKGGV